MTRGKTALLRGADEFALCSDGFGAGWEDDFGGIVVAGAPTTMGVRVEENWFHEEFKEAPVFAYENRAGSRVCDSHAGKVGSVQGFRDVGADSWNHTEAYKGFAPEAGGACLHGEKVTVGREEVKPLSELSV